MSLIPLAALACALALAGCGPPEDTSTDSTFTVPTLTIPPLPQARAEASPGA